jgi:hypothetical protein
MHSHGHALPLVCRRLDTFSHHLAQITFYVGFQFTIFEMVALWKFSRFEACHSTYRAVDVWVYMCVLLLHTPVGKVKKYFF